MRGGRLALLWETGALLGRALGAVLGGGSGAEPPAAAEAPAAGHGPAASSSAWSRRPQKSLATRLRERLAGVLEDLTASERHRRALMAPPPRTTARPADAAAPPDRHQVRCGGG